MAQAPSQTLLELPAEILLMIINRLDDVSWARFSSVNFYARQFCAETCRGRFQYQFPIEYFLRAPDIPLLTAYKNAQQKAYQSLDSEQFSAFIKIRSGVNPSLEEAFSRALWRDALGYRYIRYISDSDTLKALYHYLSEQPQWLLTPIELAIWCNQALPKEITAQQVNEISAQQLTPMMLAAYCGSTRHIAALLELGAHSNAPSEEIPSPLILASQMGHLAAIEMLLASGADISSPTGQDSALMYAVGHNHSRVVKRLLRAGAAIDHRGSWGNTPLHVAALRGNSSMVTLLIEAGAQSSLNAKGFCPLGFAAKYKYVEATSCLINKNQPLLTRKAGKKIKRFIKMVTMDETLSTRQDVRNKIIHYGQGFFSQRKKAEQLLQLLDSDNSVPENFSSKRDNRLWALTELSRQVKTQPPAACSY